MFQPLEIGHRIAGYRVVGPPMLGGFAAVYRCVSELDGSAAAIKVLDGSHLDARRAVPRFEQEVEAIRRIGHPNIVEVFTQGMLEDGRPYYVMEWLDGRSLEEELRARGPLLPADALPIVEEIGAALAAAHAVGVVHRDLKPDNIMAIPRKNWMSIKLLDFGIAKLIGADDPRHGLTTTGIAMGTVHYMAPEQILCDTIDARTDIYALGVLIFRLVTGQLPFEAPGRVAVQMMHLDQPVPRASNRAPAAAPWDAVIEHCMHKTPSRRPESIGAVLSALRAALSRRPATDTGTSRVVLQLEIDGAADTDERWNTRATALWRAAAWLRASDWHILIEADNALVARATLTGDGARHEALIDAARTVVDRIGPGRTPWIPSKTPDGLCVRAWLRPANEHQPTPTADLPSGVYLARSLAASGVDTTETRVPGLPDFFYLPPKEIRP